MISSAHHGKRKGLQTYNFKRIYDAFLTLHLTQQQQTDRGRAKQHVPWGTWYRVRQSQRSFRPQF